MSDERLHDLVIHLSKPIIYVQKKDIMYYAN